MRSLRRWLDRTPLSGLALDLMREATGQADPLRAVRPARPTPLPRSARVAFWSLASGVGASTVATLVAHRSAAGGRPPVLIDLDRWTPSLALRAGIQAATIADALLRRGRERECLSRWESITFLPGAPGLHSMFDGARVAQVVAAISDDAPAVLDLGSGAEALDPEVLAVVTRLCVVAGTRLAQLQAAFCAVPLLARPACAVGLVVVGAAPSDAERVAARLPWPHLGSVPHDPYLAADDLGVRAPTTYAIDRLVGALG